MRLHKGKMDWDTFLQEFIAQLRREAGSLEAIQTLHELSKRENITVLCYEKNGNLPSLLGQRHGREPQAPNSVA